MLKYYCYRYLPLNGTSAIGVFFINVRLGWVQFSVGSVGPGQEKCDPNTHTHTHTYTHTPRTYIRMYVCVLCVCVCVYMVCVWSVCNLWCVCVCAWVCMSM